MDMNTLVALGERIEQSSVGAAIAESRYAFPVIEGVHLIGLSISVGLIFITDLRLMGLLFTHVPVRDVIHHLRLYVLAGFALVFLSGGLLFWSEASALIESPAFPFKMLFMALAGVNALYFELVLAKQDAVQENRPLLPRNVKLAGAASLFLWTLVIICGRLIPYLPHWT
ncbi:MAG: DUF6644 family protein [Gammaproteobacteria bacterium]